MKETISKILHAVKYVTDATNAVSEGLQTTINLWPTGSLWSGGSTPKPEKKVEPLQPDGGQV